MTTGKRVESRQLEISEITRTMKIAARELDVPILLLSQMSRDIEMRTSRRPQMSNLREPGAIEQDADIVFFLDRSAKSASVENPAEADTTVDGNTVYLNIAKHRNGETGAVRLVWVPSTVTFRCVSNNHGNDPRFGQGKSQNAFIDNGDDIAPPDVDIGL